MRGRIFTKASCRRVRDCWLGRWLRVVMGDLPRGTIPLAGDGRGETTAPLRRGRRKHNPVVRRSRRLPGSRTEVFRRGRSLPLAAKASEAVEVASAEQRILLAKFGVARRYGTGQSTGEGLAQGKSDDPGAGMTRAHLAKLVDTCRHFGGSEQDEKCEAGRGGEGGRPSRQGGTGGLSGSRRGRRDPDSKAVPNSALV